MTELVELTNWTLDGTSVSVPHDAMLAEKRTPDAPTGSAGAYFPGGVYRYTYDLDVPLAWVDKHVELEFEGVMGRTRVLLGDSEVARHEYGYTGFSVDLSDWLEPGTRARITVVADNSEQPNSRWYAGSGLYRPVRLVVQDRCRIVRNGVRVTTVSTSPACVRVTTPFEGFGTPVVRIEQNGVTVAGRMGADVAITVPDARLWSAEEPNRYVAHVILRADDGAPLDEVRVPFGIRTLSWGADGLLVNGESVKLRGGCVHHDNGILGAQDLPAASRRKIALLKEWGFNAIRSAHNPLSNSMLDACDELGMYVMDEFCDMWYRPKNPHDYSRDFAACHERDLQYMVDKDRNHPCVIMYSIGNENAEPCEQRGVDTAHELAQLVRMLDDTRPVTAGVNPTILYAAGRGIDSFNGDGEGGMAAGDKPAGEQQEKANASLVYNTYVSKMGDVMELIAGSWPVGRAVEPFLDELDIAGYNYGTRRYAPDLRRCPDRLVFGSETMPYDIARNWRLVLSDPRIIGDFMWTCWDYLGECSLAAWSDDPTPVSKPYPWLCADTGALDLLGDPNGEAALARTVWGDPSDPGNPLMFVRPADLPKPCRAPWRGTNSVPCWSWRGCGGNPTTVEVYTQAPIAKLYLNGRHVGTKRVHDCHADFHLRYVPGELVGVACSASGLELGRAVLRSASGELGIRLSLERRDGDVAFVRVDAADANGTVDGGRNDEVSVRVEGGELLAFGSAAQRSVRSYLEGVFPLRYGRGLAVVRVSEDAGRCVLTANAPELGTSRIAL